MNMSAIWEGLLNVKEILLAIIALVTAVVTIRKWAVKPLEKLSERLTKEMREANHRQDEKIEILTEKMTNLEKIVMTLSDDQITLYRDRLIELHNLAMDKGWVSAAEKQRIVELYDRYIDSGHNTIHHNYRSEIVALPERPTR